MRCLKRFQDLLQQDQVSLTDVEALARCSLFWRSFTHWVGGMGCIRVCISCHAIGWWSEYSSDESRSPGPSVGNWFLRFENIYDLV